MLHRLFSRFRALTFRRDFEAGMSEELRFHLEQYADDLVRSGVLPAEASRRARLEFGGLNTVADECRQARGLPFSDEWGRELRYLVRTLHQSPGFTITALLTLALCLGANLTIFAAVRSILLRPLPFPDPHRLVTIFNTYPKAGVERDGSSLTNYYERRGRIPAFSSLSIYREITAIVGEPGFAKRQPVLAISPEFFSTLGRDPILGRSFREEETTLQTNSVVILSNSYWRQHFHADPHVLGKQMRMDTHPVTVVGVLPAGFRFLSSDALFYIPLSSRPEDRSPLQRHSGGNVTQMIARLRPGATIAPAQAQIDAQNTTLEADDPQGKAMADAGFRSLVVSLHGDHVTAVRPILLLLQGGVLLLLLMGTVNLTNLLLVRAGARVKEMAVRQSLGASRSHLLREVLLETTTLTVTGGLFGLAVAAAGIRLLRFLGTGRLPLGSQIAWDASLALLAVAASLLLGVMLALPITWFHLRHDLSNALKSETRSGTSGQAAQRLRHSFLVAQIALAFVLLAGAGLLGVSLQRTLAVSPGFQADHVLSAQISLVGNHYPAPLTGLVFTERLVKALEQQPGVLRAGVVNNIPFSGQSGKSAAYVSGHSLRPGESPRGHYSYGVAGDYFRALGFSLREGRFLDAADSRRRERVCVVDEDFARYYWPHTSALGQHLFQGSAARAEEEAFTVVGVVSSAKQAGLTEDTAQGAVYYPYIHRPDSRFYVVVRAAAVPESLGRTLESVVRQIDPELAVSDLRSMDDRIADSLLVRRSPALLAGLFSGMALLLTVIGTYGVVSYAVTQRRREIGVRVALGARPAQIRRHFLRLALRLAVGGTLLGSMGAWLAGKTMQAVLFHVRALDGMTLAGAAVIVLLASLVACLLPARRAARISAMQALAEN